MHARGAILGITRGTTREHIVRATLESIAYQSRDVLDAMVADSGIPIRELRVDGGASQSDVLMQFQADITGVPVDRPEMIETTAAGAAYLAGLATGFYPNMETLSSIRQRQRMFQAEMEVEERERLYQGWKAAVGRIQSKG